MKPILLPVLGCAALSAPGQAQDLNPFKDTVIQATASQDFYFGRSISSGAGLTSLNVHPMGSSSVVGTIPLPVDRVGDVISVRRSLNDWQLLVVGSINVPNGGTLPDVDGVMAIIEVTRTGSSWSSVVLDSEQYDDIDPWAVAVKAEEIYVLDYVSGSVWHSADFAYNLDAASVPTRAQFAQAFQGQPSSPGFMDHVNSTRFGFNFDESGVLVRNTDDPRTLLSIKQNDVGTWTSEVLADPLEHDGEILLDDISYAGNGHGLRVKVVGSPNDPPGSLSVRNPAGTTLYSQSVTPGTWVTLPPIAALGDAPGLPHSLSFGGKELSFTPSLRYGNNSSAKAGFWIGRGRTQPMAAGRAFHHGVRVHADPSLATELATVFVMYGVRDGNGVDPVTLLPGGDYFLNAAWYETHSNVEIADLHGSLGSGFSVPPGTAGLVVMMQYGVVFQDGSIAYSDVFGSTIQNL